MLLDPREISRAGEDYPRGLEALFGDALPRLWYVGEPALLRRKGLSVISARRAEVSLLQESIRLVRELSRLGSPVGPLVGGWHAPLEREALRILTEHEAEVVFCLSKGLAHFKLTDPLRRLLSGERMLLLTHCTSRARRMTRRASLRRNKIVLALGRALLVLGAPAGSAALEIATLALEMGKPVFSVPHEVNEGLFMAGARPATVENIAAVLVQR